MSIPKLKRIKVATERDLRNWLSKNTGDPDEVMIVTCNKTSRDKHISGDQVRETVAQSGWIAGRSYTLVGNLTGHVVRHI